MRFSKFLIIFILFFVVFAKAENISLDYLLKLSKEFKKENKVLLNFEKIDLKLLTYFISSLTGKNIIYPDNLKGEISLIFNKPITIKQAWDIYTAILKSRSYVVVEKNGYYEIIPEGLSRKNTPPITEKPSKSAELATYVYKLKKADIIPLTNILRGLKSPRGVVYSYNPANIIIITDTKDNIENLKSLISFVDNLSGDQVIKIYNLKYAKSSEVSSAINAILSDNTKKGVFYRVINLNSLNSIAVKAPSNLINQIDNFIKSVDKPLSTENINQRTFYTIKLKNSKAEELANILNKLLENIQLVSVQQANTKTEKIKGKTVIVRPPNINSNKDKPKVIADKFTNTLIVYANKAEFQAIKNLVENLDKQKKQVLITALIAEVSQKALKEIGVRWQIFGSSGGAAFKGGISTEGFYNLVGSTNFAAGILTSSGRSVNVSGNTLFFPDLLFLMSLLEKGTGFNIVSSPKILTMDNSKALINVSQVTPFASSLKFDVNGNPIINYDYKEVGLKLEVTPHINGKNIVMELHQETNEVIGFEKPQIGQISYVVPITSKREIDTSITVENGKTVVLGGLISKKTIDTMEGVPLLSDIPLIGNLFKYKSKEFNKTNLFVFITPFIINTPEDIAKITEEHQKILEKLNKMKKTNKKIRKVETKKKKDIIEDYNSYFGR
ncbi:type II secretion system secretin GspD [Hydrogenothermus marinus]|uniref:Type II secretion system protein D (GspD) n=1 Tax=Hydrogenothermus marinus TaxID=133270 RepID=A0A3M0BKS2_9AQUI|nr:type II secretion system secretin GspD [Hydrogenothermus marinus]RMA97747.1 type II secretion system protein D (GspD) [Hydrogenothermus marinus]